MNEAKKLYDPRVEMDTSSSHNDKNKYRELSKVESIDKIADSIKQEAEITG